MKELINKIRKRIEKIKNHRDSLTSSTRGKYNYSIGELEWIIEELEKI